MRHALTILGAGILAIAATAATAETLTSRIVDWNPTNGIVTFENERQMYLDPSVAPAEMQPGEQVTVVYEINDDGEESISEITSHLPAIDLDEDGGAETKTQ